MNLKHGVTDGYTHTGYTETRWNEQLSFDTCFHREIEREGFKVQAVDSDSASRSMKISKGYGSRRTNLTAEA